MIPINASLDVTVNLNTCTPENACRSSTLEVVVAPILVPTCIEDLQRSLDYCYTIFMILVVEPLLRLTWRILLHNCHVIDHVT